MEFSGNVIRVLFSEQRRKINRLVEHTDDFYLRLSGVAR